jgi:hypothetical protein
MKPAGIRGFWTLFSTNIFHYFIGFLEVLSLKQISRCPKCDIFDRLDSRDFTPQIQSGKWEGDLGTGIF